MLFMRSTIQSYEKNCNFAAVMQEKLGFIGLAALVFGMMVGAGIFNIPQNMAVAASPGAVLLAWALTAVGMLFLVFTFKSLSDTHPELNAGIYQYAQRGFGHFAGFNAAWGYWLCTAFANVAYAVMLNDAFGAFFPPLLEHGWLTILFGSLVIWSFYFIVCSGIRTAKILTVALSAIKIGIILLIVVILALLGKADVLSLDFWGRLDFMEIGSVGEQMKNTMLVTLWCFIGIEGAVMMAGRARRSSDIGKAGVVGFFAAWILYVLVSVLSYAVMPREQLAELEGPSAAYVLSYVVGEWAYWFVIVSIIISLTGGLVAWKLVTAEVPYTAAKAGIFPRKFLNLNSRNMPAFALMVSSIVMQLFLMLVVAADDAYMAALNITGMMILPAYLASGLFLMKIGRGREFWVGLGSSLFCVWTLWAAGMELLLQSTLFYLAGLGVFVLARRQQSPHTPIFKLPEVIALIILLAMGVISLF
ncbi:MAG: amino acid permease [Bacteroidales bacterium]|nr:amino acid permease [Bacteroidales bacterium]